ncbi:MAG: sugar transferase, partial [Gemmatimonadota bacterium]
MATTALLLLLPVMALVALAVRLTSSGPILFRQVRVGLDRRSRGNGRQDSRRQRDLGGRPFVMYKFRTMYQDAGSRGQVWASPDDPRVTPVGRFLRKTRLDELPQLWTVLKGDMNIVGPRPEQPDIFSDLRTRLEQYHRRHSRVVRARPYLAPRSGVRV